MKILASLFLAGIVFSQFCIVADAMPKKDLAKCMNSQAYFALRYTTCKKSHLSNDCAYWIKCHGVFGVPGYGVVTGTWYPNNTSASSPGAGRSGGSIGAPQ